MPVTIRKVGKSLESAVKRRPKLKQAYYRVRGSLHGARLARAVEKHSWENVPEDEKGSGKFHRKASTGGWREDPTTRQARMVEEITGPLVSKLYS